MRFKLDENLPRVARDRLSERGWDVHDVFDEGLGCALDAEIQAACDSEARVLVTLDTDFADVRRYDPAQSPGVIVLRPRDQSIQATLECPDGAFRALAIETIFAPSG